MKNFDFVIVGGGIIGLTIARELQRCSVGSIALLEKEAELGVHASGRNSGVVHAGLYYTPGSLKAKLCLDGARKLVEFATEHGISYLKNGKVIVAKNETEQHEMTKLFERAKKNGVEVEKIDRKALAQLEPHACTFDWAIHSPNTALIAAKELIQKLSILFKAGGGELLLSNHARVSSVEEKVVHTEKTKLGYGMLINCAGMYADHLAHTFDVGLQYRILPFKGRYRRLSGPVAESCRLSIYPVPNANMPFLGVHVTPQIGGKVFLGPTALPAFGRENYAGLSGMRFSEAFALMSRLGPMVLLNRGKMRNLAYEELARLSTTRFHHEVAQMAPEIQRNHIGAYEKIGLRAQLLNIKSGELEMDFVVEKGRDSIHVLNAVSPGLTASFAFSEYVVDQLLSED